MYLLSKLKTHWDKAALFVVILLLCLANYSPGTFLIGWDNLMPELNLGMNLKRSLFAAWQEYQGLGLVGGMAHATDLIRQIILLPFIAVLPASLIRYLWHFFLLFLGTFGIYFGLKKRFKGPIPFLASLFYLLNFGTVQYFWAPLESFSAFWGFFPWLIFSLWDRPLNLKKIFLINLLAIPAFYVQTLFVVYLICIPIVLLPKINLKKSLKILFLLFLINSFWLLPLGYFLKTNLTNPATGIGNFMSSDESFARNQKHGYLSDFFLLRGYYIDFPDSNGSFMYPWINHFANNYTLIAGYLLATIVIVGLLSCRRLDLILLFLLSATTLLTSTPPFSYLNELFRQFPLANQIFRAPFTKFIVPAIFAFTLLSAYGLQTLIRLASQLKYSKKASSILLTSCYLLLIFYFALPAFRGNFINPRLRRALPTDYFQLFKFFQSQNPASRIANLPSGSFWGWTNYRFGVRGSGFLWYSISQPILDRAFDAWNLKNEEYYWQLTNAIQKRDPVLLDQIFKKYSIEYVIFDKNVYFPNEIIYAKQSTPTLELLQNLESLSPVAQFNQIYVFKTPYPTQPYLITSPASIQTPDFFYQDFPYRDLSDYISSPPFSVSYPNLGLFTNRLQSESKPLINSLNLPLTDNSFNLNKTHSAATDIFAWNFPAVTFDQSYLVKIDYQHYSGLPLTLSISSDNRLFKFAETRLESKTGPNTAWFIIPQVDQFPFYSGLNVIFNNTSLNNSPNLNQVNDVSVYPLLYQNLASLQIPPSPPRLIDRTYLNFKSTIFYYQINLPSTIPADSYLVLPQSFDRGWLAVGLKGHTQANSWANAWQVNQPGTVYLIFWPQLLEFLGLFLLVPTAVLILKPAKK